MASRGVLPPNVENDGRTAGGLIKIRNLVETSIVIGSIFILEKVVLFALPYYVKLGITFVIGIPLALISLVGIGDLSLSEWFLDRKSFRKSQAIYPFKIPTKKNDEKKKFFFSKKKEKK